MNNLLLDVSVILDLWLCRVPADELLHIANLITGGKSHAPWGVTVFLGDERIDKQEPQRDGADVPLGVPCELQKSGV